MTGGRRRTGLVREVMAAGKGASPESTGFLLRWATSSPADGADLETADGVMRGFLVADGSDELGQLFAAYCVPDRSGQAPAGSGPTLVARRTDIASALAAILGPPEPPRSAYSTRPRVARTSGRRAGPTAGTAGLTGRQDRAPEL